MVGFEVRMHSVKNIAGMSDFGKIFSGKNHVYRHRIDVEIDDPMNGGGAVLPCLRHLSEFRQQPAEAVHAVGDAVGAQRMPISGGVDRDHRFSEPHFCSGGESHH